MDFEFIDESNIEGTPRGRQSNVSPKLVEAFKACPKGKVVKVSSLAGNPKGDDYKAHKQAKSATIRSAAKLAGVKVAIVWSPTGVPQVRVLSSVVGKTTKA